MLLNLPHLVSAAMIHDHTCRLGHEHMVRASGTPTPVAFKWQFGPLRRTKFETSLSEDEHFSRWRDRILISLLWRRRRLHGGA
jgi:hypothetical protein